MLQENREKPRLLLWRGGLGLLDRRRYRIFEVDRRWLEDTYGRARKALKRRRYTTSQVQLSRANPRDGKRRENNPRGNCSFSLKDQAGEKIWRVVSRRTAY